MAPNFFKLMLMCNTVEAVKKDFMPSVDMILYMDIEMNSEIVSVKLILGVELTL
jgi:hypothetical protein